MAMISLSPIILMHSRTRVGKGSKAFYLFIRIIFSIFTNYCTGNSITPRQGHPGQHSQPTKQGDQKGNRCSSSVLHAKMSRWVCCCGDSSTDHPGRGQINSVENDYLLPGSSFDSGSSRSRLGWSSRHSSKKKNANKKPAVTHSVVGLDSPSGDYEPPVVPPSQKLPTYEEFRLLKTVGRGAFGKVRYVH